VLPRGLPLRMVAGPPLRTKTRRGIPRPNEPGLGITELLSGDAAIYGTATLSSRAMIVHELSFDVNFLQFSSANFWASCVVRRPELVPKPDSGDAAKALCGALSKYV
jgi:hypothetical protein